MSDEERCACGCGLPAWYVRFALNPERFWCETHHRSGNKCGTEDRVGTLRYPDCQFNEGGEDE